MFISISLQRQSCHVAQFKLPFRICVPFSVSQLTAYKPKADIICTTVCEHAELESTLPKFSLPLRVLHTQTLRLTLSAASWAPPCTSKQRLGLLKVATAATISMELAMNTASSQCRRCMQFRSMACQIT